MNDKSYFVYILTNENNSVFYIGFTSDLKKRVWEHKNSVDDESFSSKYNIVKLIYFEQHKTPASAIRREKLIKRWKKEWKENIIYEMNPYWLDLADDWYE